MSQKSNRQDKIKAAFWGLKLAWKIDKAMLLGWTLISITLAILPAIALKYNRIIIAELSAFLSTGSGAYAAVAPSIIMMGIILTVAGLSARLNDDFLYMVMYDSFYLGLEEVMMDSAQQIEMTEFAKKEVRDEYFAAITRCGSLTDLTSSGCAFLAKMATIVSLLAVAVSISPVIFVVTILYVLLILWINAKFSGSIRTSWKDMREMLRKADYFEKLPRDGDTAKEVRVFNSSNLIMQKWEQAYHEIEKANLKRDKGMAKISLYGKLGFYGFMAAVLVFAIFSLQAGKMDTALVLMIYTLCLNLTDSVGAISQSYQRLDYGLYGLDIQRKMFEAYFKKKEEPKGFTEPLDTEICFAAHNLHFAYSEGKEVLHNLNFKIKTGETVALVGQNGCGKTTLVKLLLGLYKPTSGEVLFHGRQHEAYRKDYLIGKIGAFFQDFYLFHLSLAENVGLGNIADMDNQGLIVNAIHKGGALKLIGKLKYGLQTLLGKQVSKEGAILSGGEGQRVAVSRTHMSDKDILIFDEPASMLDPIAEMEQFFSIKEKLSGRTAILISHRIGFARLADRIMVMQNGVLVEDGTHEQLMQKDGVYAILFNEQAQWYKATSNAQEVPV